MLWSGLLGGALGGTIAAQCFALIVASTGWGIAPWLFGAAVIACGASGVWLANGYLRSHLPPFGLAETLGGIAGVWIALLLLSPIVNSNAQVEAGALDFVIVVTFIGLAIGACAGAVAGAIIGVQSVETIDALRSWLWLLGILIAVSIIVGLLLANPDSIVVALAPVILAGGALAGWLAQREALRLGSAQAVAKQIEE